MSRTHLTRILLALAAALPLANAQQAPALKKPRPTLSEEFDIRNTLPQNPAPAESLLQISTHSFQDRAGLSLPARVAPDQIVRDFLRTRVPILASGRASLENFRVDIQPLANGAAGVTLRQYVRGVPVFEGRLDVTVGADGQVWMATAQPLVPEDSLFTTSPGITAEEAIQAALRSISEPASPLTRLPDAAEGLVFRNPRAGRHSPIAADLTILPIPPDGARLAWRISLDCGGSRWYEFLIDAANGQLLFRHRLSVRATARVWKDSPAKGPRELLTLPASWLPQQAQSTTGPYVDAYLDSNGDDSPDSSSAPNILSGRANSPLQTFDFPAGEGSTNQDPRLSQAASVTNLFYFANVAHDYFYSLGFTEAAWNFQSDNGSRGGTDGDPVLAEAQDGALTDNAEFIPTRDGVSPRLRIGIFTMGTTYLPDDRDADFDGTVVIHEYTHGVSNRLVGRGADTTCLAGPQSGAMGEGWSDYFALSYLNDPVAGAYISANSVHGSRRSSYDTNTFTYADFGETGYEVHADGEIWGGTLWEIRKTLTPIVADRLFVDALKLTPCHPSMLQARDAILAADQAGNKGANRAGLWTIFAKRGFGYSACGIDGNTATGTLSSAVFDLPPDLQTVPKPPALACPADGIGQPAMTGTPFRFQIPAASNSGPLRFQLTYGPSGMTVNDSGVIAWSPTFVSQRAQVTVTNAAGQQAVYGMMIPVLTPLKLSQPVVIGANQDEAGQAYFDVVAGSGPLQWTLRGGTGDADLVLLDPGGRPAAYSLLDGNDETITVPQPIAGRWTLIGIGYQSFANVTLQVAAMIPQFLGPTATLANLSGVASSETYFRIPLLPNVATRVTTTGSAAIVILGGLGRCPYCTFSDSYECDGSWDTNPTRQSSIQGVVLTSPQRQDLYVMLKAFNDYSGLQIATAATGASPTLMVGASSLSFVMVEGGTPPAAQTVPVIDAAGSTPTFTFATDAAWLLAASSNLGLSVSIAPNVLTPATYTGKVTVTSPSLADSPQVITVTLVVTGTPVLAVSPAGLSFTVVQGQPVAPQTVALTFPGNWTASAKTTSGGNWLTIGSGAGSGNATLSVSADTTGLAAGKYSGAVTITAAGGANSPQTIAVDLNLVAAVLIAKDGILNAATMTALPVASFERLAIVGAGLADPCDAVCPSVTSAPYPTQLGNAMVTINGVAAGIVSASPEQLVVVAPETSGSTASIVVTRGAVAGTPVSVSVAEQSLGIFTVLGNGAGAAIILHADGNLVSRDNPLTTTETVTIAVTGIGQSDSPLRIYFDGVVGEVVSAIPDAGSGIVQLTVNTPGWMPRQYPVVILESDLSGAQNVSAGGISLLSVTPAQAKAWSDLPIRIRGINFPSAGLLMIGDTSVDAIVTSVNGEVQILAVLPANLVAPGALSICVADGQAPDEESSNELRLNVTP